MADSESTLHDTVTELAEADDVRLDDESGDLLDAVEAADEPAIEEPEATGEAGQEAVEEAIEALNAPEHWNDAYREAFAKVDRETQEQWLAQSQDWQRGLDNLTHEYKEYQQQVKPLEAVAPLLQQAAPFWQAQGMGVEQGLGQLLQWGFYLAQDPQAAIPQIAKLYGVDLEKVAGEQPYLTPAEREYQERLTRQQREVEDLRSQVSQQQYERTLDVIGSFRSEVDADGNPAHPHFDKVSDQITQMYQSGFQGPLSEAYDRAIWLNPEIRSELIKSEQNGAVKQVVQQNTESARRAEGRANQRVRHAQSGSSSGVDLENMSTEQLVAHMARQQQQAAR